MTSAIGSAQRVPARSQPAGRQPTSVGMTPPVDSNIRMSCRSMRGSTAQSGSAGLLLLAGLGAHRAHFARVRAHRAALVSLGAMFPDAVNGF